MDNKSPSPATHRALLIGVNEYRNYQPFVDLNAPRNDVVAWFKLLRRLGVPPANIQVVTSPLLTLEELDCDDAMTPLSATTDVLDQALLDFYKGLEQADSCAVGTVFVSGHGDFSVLGGRSLYLSDYAGRPPGVDQPGGILNLAEAMGRQRALAPKAHLTWLVDICREPLPQALQQIDSLNTESSSSVILAAASTGQEAFERCYDGTWRGQFTWAAMTILRNWPTTTLANGLRYVNISPQTLRDRIGALIEVFNASHRRQAPDLFTPHADGPFLLPGLREHYEVSDHAVAAPAHEFPGDTCDFTYGGVVIGTVSFTHPGTQTHAVWKFSSNPPFSGASSLSWSVVQSSGFTGTPALTRTSWTDGVGGDNELGGATPIQVSGGSLPVPAWAQNPTWYSCNPPSQYFALAFWQDNNATWWFNWYLGLPTAPDPKPKELPTSPAMSPGLATLPTGWTWYVWNDRLLNVPSRLTS